MIKTRKIIFTSFLKIIGITILMAWTLFPIYWMFSLGIRQDMELTQRLSFFPRTFTYAHFVDLFENKKFGLAMANSLKITLISLGISLVCAIPCSYIFSRKRFQFAFQKSAMLWVLLTRVLPPISFAIPLYTMMNRLHLINTQIPIIAAHVLLNIPFIIWFLISFFTGLPEELEESAKIDGAGELVIFKKIVLPLIAPGITAVTILSFMTSWNEYLYGVIFVQSPQKFTIPLTLATLNSEQELAQWGNIAAGGILSLIPIMIFVIFAQNYLISGLSNGAVKE